MNHAMETELDPYQVPGDPYRVRRSERSEIEGAPHPLSLKADLVMEHAAFGEAVHLGPRAIVLLTIGVIEDLPARPVAQLEDRRQLRLFERAA